MFMEVSLHDRRPPKPLCLMTVLGDGDSFIPVSDLRTGRHK